MLLIEVTPRKNKKNNPANREPNLVTELDGAGWTVAGQGPAWAFLLRRMSAGGAANTPVGRRRGR
jgi:hypothetical protein